MQALMRHIRNNVVGYIALIVALGAGTAVAADGPLKGRNTVGSADIIDKQVLTRDLKDGGVQTQKLDDDAVVSLKVLDESLVGADILNGSLSGADVGDQSLSGADVAPNSIGGGQIDESSLGQVAAATLGGFGRYAVAGKVVGQECAPSGSNFVTCVFTTLNLPRQTRVLVVGHSLGRAVSSPLANAVCRLATSTGVTLADTHIVLPNGELDNFTLVAISPPIGPGAVDFGLECQNFFASHSMEFTNSDVAAVAISPD